MRAIRRTYRALHFGAGLVGGPAPTGHRCAGLSCSSFGADRTLPPGASPLSRPNLPQRLGQSFAGLLVVLLIVTLMTALAAPHMDLTRFRSDAIARQAAGVFASAARDARRFRRDVMVRIDSAGRRLGTVSDGNVYRVRDGRPVEAWVALDRAASIVDPPRPLLIGPGGGGLLAGAQRADGPVASGAVVFRRGGGASADLVLYLTSDPGLPRAWRAIHVTARTGSIQIWRFDGSRWTRART